ncbi:hypothetical protein HXX76_011457 [Chlamydomonas incerta]|uniref:Endonuclease/exonuclease/phosphatase domain-containing protein n=1 Tax=Chlamydomonas incerta TaxID=51695 RepID=A0A835VUV1_CHLIN|nr:hypothetical protein HXX76_011457 [Chlamydomonas incerta]|eukprot:KAG2428755.1 hypothetical protein HXX76_011457 [Chlamydomonas incerta]
MEANADIICLQELNHFEDLSQVLKELGYEGAFREKHASPALKYEYPPDGMAVFYRSGRFTCSAGAVEGRSFQDDCTGREQSQGYLQILLHDLLVGRDLLVVTTHLKAKDGAECEDMRYQQAKQLLRNVSGTLERLEKTSQEAAAAAGGNGSAGSAAHGGGNGSSSSKAGGNGSSNGAGPNGSGSGHAAGGAAAEREHLVPVVVTGDFNTLPGSKTCRAFREHPLGLMSLWEQRPIDATLSSGSDMDMPPPPPPPAPAAAGSSGAGGAAAAAAEAAAPTLPSEFSTWKFRVKGESKRISDYIYFSGGGLLRPLQRWRMLTEAEIGPTALPSPAYASDHVSLCCEFEWDVDADLEWAPRSREPDWG